MCDIWIGLGVSVVQGSGGIQVVNLLWLFGICYWCFNILGNNYFIFILVIVVGIENDQGVGIWCIDYYGVRSGYSRFVFVLLGVLNFFVLC